MAVGFCIVSGSVVSDVCIQTVSKAFLFVSTVKSTVKKRKSFKLFRFMVLELCKRNWRDRLYLKRYSLQITLVAANPYKLSVCCSEKRFDFLFKQVGPLE